MAATPFPLPLPQPAAGPPPKLLDRVRAALRVCYYRLRTEEASVAWSRRFLLFYGVRHLAERGAAEINQFLTDLAMRGHVSVSTQNQALRALLFLYQAVLAVDPGRIEGVVRAPRPRCLHAVLTRAEVQQVRLKYWQPRERPSLRLSCVHGRAPLLSSEIPEELTAFEFQPDLDTGEACVMPTVEVMIVVAERLDPDYLPAPQGGRPLAVTGSEPVRPRVRQWGRRQRV
jgi:hypothetical protein